MAFDNVVQAFVRVDTQTREKQTWFPGTRCFCEELVFVPGPNAATEELDGFLLGMVYDASQNRSFLAVSLCPASPVNAYACRTGLLIKDRHAHLHSLWQSRHEAALARASCKHHALQQSCLQGLKQGALLPRMHIALLCKQQPLAIDSMFSNLIEVCVRTGSCLQYDALHVKYRLQSFHHLLDCTLDWIDSAAYIAAASYESLRLPGCSCRCRHNTM